MKTLPYLKQITYVSLVVTLPFIFSASRDTTPPEIMIKPIASTLAPSTRTQTETIKTIKLTVDSLKKSIAIN